ncbi:c-type cytochrome, partial [Microbacteriaceae bacterium K1510]|nr:c-type cytochrome [Microbacteriaceae bacterium K1510]
SLDWPNTGREPAPPEVVKKAEAINLSVACTACHQSEYEGDGTTPRLASQSREYLDKTIQDFRSGARGNNPGMSDILRAVSEEDLAIMAEYLAGLR